jgi:hypothetical protein
MTLTNGAKKSIYLRRLLTKIQIMDNSEPIKLMCDNQNAIKLLENPVFHDQTKHIVIKHHFIR